MAKLIRRSGVASGVGAIAMIGSTGIAHAQALAPAAAPAPLAAPAPQGAPAPAPAPTKWLDKLKLGAFVDAYDAKTGHRAWRFYTVPGGQGKPTGVDPGSQRMAARCGVTTETGTGRASGTSPDTWTV